jgi:hypothetical protein
MALLITILIILSCLIFFGIGLYIVLQKKPDEAELPPSIFQSGVYSLLRKSPAESLRAIKPSAEDIKNWLIENDHSNIAEVQSELWEKMLQKSISIVEKGDIEGTQTYRFHLEDVDVNMCGFLSKDSYITREMIYNHPELLPPFTIGSNASLMSKEAWDNQSKSGWTPILPVDGKYDIPDWRQIV